MWDLFSDWFGGSDDYSYEPSYDYGYSDYDYPSYDYSYEPSYDYSTPSYDYPSYDYSYEPSYDYGYSDYDYPSYDYSTPSYDTSYNEYDYAGPDFGYTYDPYSGISTSDTGSKSFSSFDEPVVWSDIQGQEQDLTGMEGMYPAVYNEPTGSVSVEPTGSEYYGTGIDPSRVYAGRIDPSDNYGTPGINPNAGTGGTTVEGWGYNKPIEITGVGQNPDEMAAGTGSGGSGMGDWLGSAGQWIKDNPVLAGAGTVGTVMALSKLFGGSKAAAPVVTGGGTTGGGATTTPGGATTTPGGTPGSTGTTSTSPGGSVNTTTPGTTTPGTTTPGTTTPGTTTPTTDWSTGLPDWLKAALGVGGAALVAPYLSGMLNPGTTTPTAPPDYLGQFGTGPTMPGTGAGGYASQFPGFSNPGLNPGWMQAGVPQYNQQLAKVLPGQNQYNWGTKPYMGQMSDLPQYTQASSALPQGPVNPFITPAV